MSEVEKLIRDQVAMYVEGYISADDFNDRLPDVAVMDEANDPVAMNVLMVVIGHLAEYQSGDKAEAELRRALAPHAGWSIDRTLATGVKTRPGLVARVGAGTPLQVARV